jgi:hypothetical protein
MRDKLTYANVTATLALFIALGGSSYAAVKITGKDVANESLTTKDVKNRSLLKRDFKAGQLPAGARGLQGLKGDQGLQGQKGNNGNDGAPGADGTAKAFAVVSAQGALYDFPNRKNVDRSTQIDFGSPLTGIYCLHTTFTPHNVVATLSGNGSEPGEITATTLTDASCTTGGPPYNVQVNTFDSTGVAADRAFYVAIN